MELRWTTEAADNLEEIYDYYKSKSPKVGHSAVSSVLAALARIQQFPYIGRLGIRPGTRELVLTDIPYLIAYRIQHETVVILSIRHGARQLIQ